MTLESAEGSRLRLEIERLRRESQRVQHRAFTQAPLAGEVPEGGVVFARISGTTYLYTKIGDQLSRVALTDV